MLKKALVTGSARGIGRAIALDLAARGFDVAFHYRTRADAARAACREAAAQGGAHVALQADVTRPEEARGLVDGAAAALGGLSVVVNAVGDYLGKPTSRITTGEWLAVLDSNLNATFHVTQAALPHLRAAGAGRILNLGCAGAHELVARDASSAYVVAKTGVVLYTKSLAKELAAERITANVLSPGIAENSFEYEAGAREPPPRLPLGRPATLSELVRAAWFFLAPEAEYVTGQVLEVAGGWRL